VHRDLKPDNVLIKTENFILNGIIIKLSDFGTLLNIANIADNPSSYSDDIIGSLIYISPEQRQGKVLNQQSDIFSLGILFYQLLIEDTYEYRLRFDESFKGLDYDEKFAFQTIINRMCEGDLRFRYKSLSDVFIDIKRKTFSLNSYFLNKLEFPIWAKPIEKNLDIDFPSSNIYHSIKYFVHRYDEELWRFPAWNSEDDGIDNTLYDYPTEAIVSSGTVLAGWNTGYFTSISLYSGKLNWSIKLSNEAIYSTPVCKSGKIYVVNKSGKLFCVDAYTGETKWMLDLNDDCSCPLNIIGNLLYIVSNLGKIFLVDKEIGTLTTTLQFKNTGGYYRNPQIHNTISFDKSLVFSHEDYIYGYPDITQIKEGKAFNWLCSAPVEVRCMSCNSISGMAYDGKKIFATTLFGSVLCLNSVTGDGVWKIDTGEDIFSSPSIFEDFVTFITANGYLYVCDKINGTLLKRKYVGDDRSYRHSRDDEDYVTAIMSEETILIVYKYCLKLLDRTSYKEVTSWEIGKEPRPCPTFSRNIVITSSTTGLVAFQQKMSNKGIGGC
jgi:outer membrane protein assembly factor BamB